MDLTSDEIKKVVSLQRKLKLVRAWKSLGKKLFFIFSIFDKKTEKWENELRTYCIKKFRQEPKQVDLRRRIEPVKDLDREKMMRCAYGYKTILSSYGKITEPESNREKWRCAHVWT